MYFSFWGGERSNCRYLGSNYLYRAKLSQIIEKYADGLIGTDIRTAYIWKHHDKVPTDYYGTLGSSSMDFICDLVDNSSQNKSKDYYGISPEKVSVQIGYSGKEIHQQCEIIQALREHPDLKEKIHLVAPMTRGANKAFTEKVETALRESGFSYTLLKDRFLTDEEMAKLRFAQDVVFQLSTYDGYSRSIIECLSAGAIVIYGKWLNYDSKFAEDGFEGIGVDSIGEAVEQLAEIVKHPHNYTELRKLNQEKAKKKYLWAECIKDWVAVYNGTAQPLNEQE